jgi:putative phosphoribosyl transferase
MVETQFRNRDQAGQLLAREVRQRLELLVDPIVLALPRGGVPVAFYVAEELGAPLDVFVVRKLGVPGHEELAMGAIASGGVRVLNHDVLAQIPVSPRAIDAVAEREQLELERRERAYRGNRPPLHVANRTVIIVDDGLATGSTMRAAVDALRQMKPQAIVVAVPVAAPETCEQFRAEVDEIVCLHTPRVFRAVGLWYEDFEQTTDEEVHRLLADANARTKGAA